MGTSSDGGDDDMPPHMEIDVTMTTNNENIINKIKNAINYANGTNHADSETALAMAMRLAAKHNIDIQSIMNASEDPLKNYHNMVGFEFGLRVPTEWHYIRVILTDFFNVNTIEIPAVRKMARTGKINFIGTKENIEIAQYVYNQLYIQFKRLFEQAKNRHGLKTTDKRSYYNGLYKGFYVRLKNERQKLEQELALAIIKDPKIDEAFSAFYPKVKNKAIAAYAKDSETINKGFADSDKINISKAVGGTTTKESSRMLLTDGMLKSDYAKRRRELLAASLMASTVAERTNYQKLMVKLRSVYYDG